MSDVVEYFGYGANRDPRMIAAILGKPTSELVGRPGTLQGFGIGVQALSEVPDYVAEDSELPVSPRQILQENWGDDFRSWVIFPKEGGEVVGTIWTMTPEERERVRDWELVGDWYKDDTGTAVDEHGNEVPIITESLGDGQTFTEEADGRNYEIWLQDPGLFEDIAERTRQEYDERLAAQQLEAEGTDFKK